MPVTTPKQKVNAVERLGKKYIEIILSGDTYDDAKNAALKFKKEDKIFVSPFDHKLIIEGQGTVALEILSKLARSKSIIYLR